MENKILDGTYTWKEAILTQGGGWRLPNIFELLDIYVTTADDRINGFWSASPYAGNAPFMWGVHFYDGCDHAFIKSFNLSVRLVRGEPANCAPVTGDEVIAYKLKQQNTKEKAMKLEVGKKYETLDGHVYEVVHIIDAKPGARYPVVAVEVTSKRVRTYTLDGTFTWGVVMATDDDLIKEHIKTPFYCGYTKEQWKNIIEGDFLCGFSNNVPQKALAIQTLSSLISTEEGHNFIAYDGVTWANCSPVCDKGIRQPWFGGECPVQDSMMVLVTWRDGSSRYGPAKKYDWRYSDTLDDIVEFIYLKDG